MWVRSVRDDELPHGLYKKAPLIHIQEELASAHKCQSVYIQLLNVITQGVIMIAYDEKW